MDREQTKEAIRVMQAYIDGEEVEWRYRDPDGKTGNWCPYQDDSYLNYEDFEYRIKPKPREFWLVYRGDGDGYLLADKEAQDWTTKPIKVREVLDE